MTFILISHQKVHGVWSSDIRDPKSDYWIKEVATALAHIVKFPFFFWNHQVISGVTVALG